MTGIGIIGCGQIAHFHYEGFERAGAKIAHVCDVRADAAKPVAERYGARLSTDYRAVLADPEVQLVCVLSSARTHREICLAAIAAGKGVVCEKTLSDNPADAAVIASAGEKAKAFVATAYMKRFFPAAQQMKKLLAEMGPIVSIHARSFQPWDGLLDGPIPDSFRERPSPVMRGYGGGVLTCAGSHILDLLHWLSGRPTKVVGQMHVRDGLDFELQANAMLWLKDGGMAHLETLWHSLNFAGFERNGWDERLEINTAHGRLDFYTVLWNKPTNNGALLVHQDGRTGQTSEYRYAAVNPFDLEMAEMLRTFEAGEPATPSAWDGYVVDELLATIAKSAKEGRVVEMEYRDGKR